MGATDGTGRTPGDRRPDGPPPVPIVAAGTFAVDDPPTDRAIGRGLARELLALLVAHRGEPLDTSVVVASLWPVEAPATAPTIVHGAVARLRRALGPEVVVRTDAGYLLAADRVRVDLWAVLDRQADGHPLDPGCDPSGPPLGPYADRGWAGPFVARVDAATRPPDDRVLVAPTGIDLGPFVGASVGGGAVTRLVGRRRELAALREARRRSRLVTVVGLGGVGKSRLVTEAVADDPGRVLRIDLGRGSGPFANRLAGALGAILPPQDAAVRAALAGLIAKVDLLVLDGCEHELPSTADAVSFLLERWPALRVLASSRVALGVSGEHIVPLLPFADPGDPRGDAATLFLDRVQASGLPLTWSDRDRAAAVCQACAGIPLAIELAASDVLGRSHPTGDENPPEVVVRERIADALAALTPPASALARGIALLPAGITPATASRIDTVSGTVATRELMGAGMLHAEARGAGRRFYLPDSLRLAVLALTTTVDHTTVAGALARVGERASPDGGAGADVADLALALAELENVAALLPALATAGAHRARLELALAFRGPWFEHGQWADGATEILDALAATETDGELDPVPRAEVIAGAFEVAGTFEGFARLIEHADPAATAAAAGGRLDLVVGLRYAEACGLGYQGRIEEAAVAAAAARDAAERSGSPILLLRVDGLDALVALGVGRPEVARRGLRAVAERCRDLGWAGHAARVLLMSSHAALAMGDDATALADARDAEEMAVAGLARASLAWIRAQIATLELASDGDRDRVRSTLEAALDVAVPAGQLRVAGICRLRLGLLDDDPATIARSALDLLDVDGRAAALALSHLLGRPGDLDRRHRLRRSLPAVLGELADGGGSPLGAEDAAIVEAVADRSRPPDPAWREALEADLLHLVSR